jgi:hypothetical protein
LPTHDVVPWGAIILGHVKFWQGQQALDSILINPVHDGVQANSVTFIRVLNAFAILAAQNCKQFHKQIIQRGCKS